MGIKVFSVNWWVSTLVSAFVLMIMFYIIKTVNKNLNIPVVGDIIENV